ncbi:unnamed protein product [Calicophoron daubneyi]|uniref:Uncharacterized protein n=1 Tax=Calicophoron daubneyi TaxID=300641 RepID=A0AAV2THW8_CALDB
MRWSTQSSRAPFPSEVEGKQSISALERLIEETKKDQEELEFENWMMKSYVDRHGLSAAPEIKRSGAPSFGRKSFARRSQAAWRATSYALTKVTKEMKIEDKATLAKFAEEELKRDIEDAKKTGAKIVSDYKFKHIEQGYELKDIEFMRKKMEKIFQTRTRGTYFDRVRAEDFEEFIKCNVKRLSNLLYFLRGQNQVLQQRINEMKAESAKKDVRRKSLTVNDFAKLHVAHACSANRLKDLNSDLFSSKQRLSKVMYNTMKARRELKRLLDSEPTLSRAQKKINNLLRIVADETEDAWGDVQYESNIRELLRHHKSHYRCPTVRRLIEDVSPQLLGQKAYSDNVSNANVFVFYEHRVFGQYLC